MDRDTPLSAEKDVIVDANIFIAIGDPSHPQFARFQRAVQDAGVVLKLPQRVIGELGGRDIVRVQAALDEGWAEIILSAEVSPPACLESPKLHQLVYVPQV